MDDKDLIGPLLPIGTIVTAIFAIGVSAIFITGAFLILCVVVVGAAMLFCYLMLTAFNAIFDAHDRFVERKRLRQQEAERLEQEAIRSEIASRYRISRFCVFDTTGLSQNHFRESP